MKTDAEIVVALRAILDRCDEGLTDGSDAAAKRDLECFDDMVAVLRPPVAS
jgi:hypothetical protein